MLLIQPTSATQAIDSTTSITKASISNSSILMVSISILATTTTITTTTTTSMDTHLETAFSPYTDLQTDNPMSGMNDQLTVIVAASVTVGLLLLSLLIVGVIVILLL